MTITGEQAANLVERLQTPWPEDDSAAEVNLPAWVIDLCEEAAAALIASEAARKLAEERLAKAAHSLARCADFIERGLYDRAGPVVREARAILKENDNG